MNTTKLNAQSDNTLALRLAGELRVLIGKLKRRLRKEANFGELTEPQQSVLLHLERDGPTTVTALAHLNGVRPQSMGATVSVLEIAGLINRAPDPTDGRQSVLSLTDACRDAIRAGRAAREDWLYRSIESNLTAVEQKKLTEAIAILQRLADSAT